MGSRSCAICFELYNVQERMPKFLSCHHTFCKSCLQGLQVNGALTCPNCRAITTVSGINGVTNLQSNMYILEHLEEQSSSQLPVEVPEDLSWCPQCRSSESTDCSSTGHVVVDLSKEEDLKASFPELQLYFDTCKFKWQSALTQRERVTESVDAINAAIQILAQKAQALQRENQNKMTHLRYMLKGVDKASSIASNRQKNLSGKEMKGLLQQNSSKAEQSDVEYRAASVLARSLDTISDSTVTVQIVKGPSKQLVPAALFENNTLSFTSSRASITDWESQLLTSLSFLCLAAGPSGNELLKKLKLTKPPNPAAAGQSSKPKTNLEGNQNTNLKKSSTANEQQNFGNSPHQKQSKKTKQPIQDMKQPEDISAPQEAQKKKNKQPKPQQQAATGNQGGTKPKQNKSTNKNKPAPNFDAATSIPYQPSQGTASNLGDILKQAAIEAAIGGLQNLAESLAEEKMNIPSQRKNYNKK